MPVNPETQNPTGSKHPKRQKNPKVKTPPSPVLSDEERAQATAPKARKRVKRQVAKTQARDAAVDDAVVLANRAIKTNKRARKAAKAPPVTIGAITTKKGDVVSAAIAQKSRQHQAKVKRIERQSKAYEAEHRSDIEKALASGAVGLIDKHAGDIGREVFMGSKNPSAAQVLLAAAPLGALKAAKPLIRVVRGARGLGTAERAAEAARVAAGLKKGRQAERVAARQEARAGALSKTGAAGSSAKATAKGLGKQARKRLSKVEAKAAAKRSAARSADRAVRNASGAAVVAATPTPLGHNLRAAGEGHVKALVENPGKVAVTTGRTLMGFPLAAGGDALDLATGNFGDFAKSQGDYFKGIGKMFTGDAEKTQKLVENDYGLVPAATGALIGRAAYKGTRTVGPKKVRPKVKPAKVSRRRGRDLATLRDPHAPKDAKDAARKRLESGADYKEPRRQAHQNRKRGSEESSRRAEEQQGVLSADMRETGKRKKGRLKKRSIEEDMRVSAKNEVADGIMQADTVNLLGRLGVSGREPDLLDILKRRRNDIAHEQARLVERGKPIPRPESKDTLRVLDALIAAEGKSVGSVQGLLDRYATYQRHQSSDRGKEIGLSGPSLSDEHVRYSELMDAERIPTRDERVPLELQGVTSIPHGPRVDARIRAAGKRKIRRAKKLEAQGKLEEAAAKRKVGEAELAVVDRFKRADSLDILATKIEQGRLKPDDERRSLSPTDLRAQAADLRKKGDISNRRRAAASIREAKDVVKKSERREPIYFKQDDVTEPANSPNSGEITPRGAKKEQWRTGALARTGRVDESAANVLQGLFQQRGQIAERARTRDMLTTSLLRKEDGFFGTREQWARVGRHGDLPDGYGIYPTNKVAGTIQRTPALRKELEAKRIDAKALEEGTVYVALPHSRYKEWLDQQERSGKAARVTRIAGRAQGIALLATSPVWFVFQIPATFVPAVARHPNPLDWVTAARGAVQTWRNLTPRERAQMHSLYGANSADFLAVGENVRGLGEYNMGEIRRTAERAMGTPAGRMLEAIKDSVKHGGPLMQLNRKMEANLRILYAQLEMDRLSGLNVKGSPRLTARPLEFVGKIADAQDVIYKHMRALEGMTPAERARFIISDKGKALQRDVQVKVNRMMGDWASMTKRERDLTGLIPFYPYVRFSLRWLKEFTADNPVKAAIYLNLAQQNAQELEKLLGGPPGFFNGWGAQVTHLGDGTQIVDLSRAAPGGNAIVESTLGGSDLATSVLRTIQPAIGATVQAGFGRDPYGNPKEDASFWQLEAKGLLGLNTLTRPLGDKIIPPGNISRLFREIEGRPQTDDSLGSQLLYQVNPAPQLFPDVAEQKEMAKLSRLLDKAYSTQGEEKTDYKVNSPERKAYDKRVKESQKAFDQIDKMLVKYGIETRKAQKKEEERAIHRTYDEPGGGRSSFDSTFGGGGSGGSGSSSGGSGGGAYSQVFGGG